MEDVLDFASNEKPLLRVLIVEDNPDDEYFAKRAIYRILPGSSIGCVSGIGEAYQACKKNEFDLILLDLNLPDGYGPNSVQELRKFVRTSAIIVLTGLASPLTTQQSIEKGAYKLFMKSQLNTPEFEEAVLEIGYAYSNNTASQSKTSH